MTFRGAREVHEGGLVAQQVGSCPRPEFDVNQFSADNPALTPGSMQWYMALITEMRAAQNVNTTYCEYRDMLVRAGGFEDEGSYGAGPGRTAKVEVTIHNALLGSHLIFVNGTRLKFVGNNSHRYSLTAGETRTIELEISGRGNFIPDDDGSNQIQVFFPGNTDQNNPNGSWDIHVIDDDNTAYIGRRRAHPYGDIRDDGAVAWLPEPHCWGEVGCAYDAPAP